MKLGMYFILEYFYALYNSYENEAKYMYLLKYFMYCTTATRMKLGMYFILKYFYALYNSYENEARHVLYT